MATTLLLFATILVALQSIALGPQEPAERLIEDRYQQRVDMLELQDEDIFEGFAKLNQRGFSSFTIERILASKLVGPPLTNPKFTTRIESRSLREVLDWLCSLDSRYTWLAGARATHIVPRAVIGDPKYLLNRIIPNLEFRDEPDAERATLNAVGQLPAPKEDIAFLQLGGSVTFAKPWTKSLKDISVREAFTLIAAQIGSDFGWQFGGSEEFRLIMFHHSLVPRSEYEKQRQLRMKQPPN